MIIGAALLVLLVVVVVVAGLWLGEPRLTLRMGRPYDAVT